MGTEGTSVCPLEIVKGFDSRPDALTCADDVEYNGIMVDSMWPWNPIFSKTLD